MGSGGMSRDSPLIERTVERLTGPAVVLTIAGTSRLMPP